jgi:hypothetical protein
LSWFQGYRAVMRYGASWVSPPSFALAENAYFVWMNMYDPDYQMHEWAWYSGNPTNPDGDFNFVWGDGNDGWIKFPMKEWYMAWLFPTGLWFLLLTFISKRKKAAVQRGIQIIPPRLMFFGLGDALRWLILRGVQEVPGLDQDL